MMTSNPIILLSSLLFAFACIFFNFSLAADPVLDTAGHPLHSGVNYYILSAGNGSGLKPAKGVNNTCPFEVTVAGDRGFPLRISPVNSTADGAILEKADVTVEFSPSGSTSGCPQSTVWLVQDLLVTTGGDGKGSGASLFTIQKYEDAYAFQFCPRAAGCFPPFCPRLPCGYIGIQLVDGTRRLAFNRSPFKIVFQFSKGFQ